MTFIFGAITSLRRALKDVDLGPKLCITSDAQRLDLFQSMPSPLICLSFRNAIFMRVAVEIVNRAEGRKCARSWKISPEVGSDPEYPDVTPRDARALREWAARQEKLA